jgi:aryl sulfotransferase
VLPTRDHDYNTLFFDNGRWDAFERRAGDIVVCTSYKAGTTWTQMICALLVHKTAELPRPLAELSPWLDMQLAPIDRICANYGAQNHRRVIKTHTPLDGLPYDPDLNYIVCGRDPRDVFMSMQNHLDNHDMAQSARLLAAQGIEIKPPPPMPSDVNERFHIWITQGSFDWEQDGAPYWSHFRHAETFWKFRNLPNIHFTHYADLKTDLGSVMQRLAGILGENIEDVLWPELVKAATFEDMKANADRTAPDTDHGTWKDNSRFFNKGINEQWRGVLSEENLAIYERVKHERYDSALVHWIENGGPVPT